MYIYIYIYIYISLILNHFSKNEEELKRIKVTSISELAENVSGGWKGLEGAAEGILSKKISMYHPPNDQTLQTSVYTARQLLI